MSMANPSGSSKKGIGQSMLEASDYKSGSAPSNTDIEEILKDIQKKIRQFFVV